MTDVDVNRCEFPKQGTTVDTREFTPGEVVCVYSTKHGLKRGIYEAPAPALGKLRMHLISGLGSEKPQRVFFGYVGKLRELRPEDRSKALGEVRNLPQDVEDNVFSFLGGQRCSFPSNEAPIQPDTRTFQPGEQVCLRDIVLSGNRRPTTGLYKRKMGTFLIVEAEGIEVPTPHFNVGKIELEGPPKPGGSHSPRHRNSKQRTHRGVP